MTKPSHSPASGSVIVVLFAGFHVDLAAFNQPGTYGHKYRDGGMVEARWPFASKQVIRLAGIAATARRASVLVGDGTLRVRAQVRVAGPTSGIGLRSASANYHVSADEFDYEWGGEGSFVTESRAVTVINGVRAATAYWRFLGQTKTLDFARSGSTLTIRVSGFTVWTGPCDTGPLDLWAYGDVTVEEAWTEAVGAAADTGLFHTLRASIVGAYDEALVDLVVRADAGAETRVRTTAEARGAPGARGRPAAAASSSQQAGAAQGARASAPAVVRVAQATSGAPGAAAGAASSAQAHAAAEVLTGPAAHLLVASIAGASDSATVYLVVATEAAAGAASEVTRQAAAAAQPGAAAGALATSSWQGTADAVVVGLPLAEAGAETARRAAAEAGAAPGAVAGAEAFVAARAAAGVAGAHAPAARLRLVDRSTVLALEDRTTRLRLRDDSTRLDLDDRS